MRTVDARGLSCPQPVLLCKEAIDAGENDFLVLVDDVAPLENVSRYAKNNGCKVSVTSKDDYDEIHCTKA